MGALEIILIVACVLIVGGVIAVGVINKKRGKNACEGNCGSCSACHSCKKPVNKK